MSALFMAAILIGIIVFMALFLHFIPLGLWISAYFAGIKVSLFKDLVGMRLRKVPPRLIVLPKISAEKSGLQMDTGLMEAHYLAGGHVEDVISALIAADKANIALSFERATAIDLAGRDVLEAVRMTVNPKVIDTPLITAVAKDGVQVRAKARVTVRTNINRLIGGAGEETIVARVGEGIVTTIGSADTHKQVLESPSDISKTVLGKGLDANTAFEILSIDIADVEVGENIGAKLQEVQADTDLKIARAKAEERRAMAEAREQEMLALVREMSARVTEAEVEVPRAMAEAFRTGNLGLG